MKRVDPTQSSKIRLPVHTIDTDSDSGIEAIVRVYDTNIFVKES